MRLQQTKRSSSILFLQNWPEHKQQIEDGKSEADIRKSWETGLEKFKKMRAKYLIY
jgi:uncharacterized protein YbbC (DUF1343 family)